MTGFERGLPDLGLLLAALLAAPVAVTYLITVFRRNTKAAWLTIGLSVLTALLFLLPFVLWSQNDILFYRTATICALVLVAVICFAGYRYLRRYATMSATTDSITAA